MPSHARAASPMNYNKLTPFSFLHFNPSSIPSSADLRGPLGLCVCGTVDLLFSQNSTCCTLLQSLSSLECVNSSAASSLCFQPLCLCLLLLCFLSNLATVADIFTEVLLKHCFANLSSKFQAACSSSPHQLAGG
ncbi:hypothetical protein RchiOBHm_Chr2g0133261 [Rosa chinensis]|uniref:Uncharacterized protein n=1 Tax=Rosa chinensis TaxID=74649 RepID=A0A2P6RVI9_ROSCH|nr:hypothetical protein RchiOBHm_Chr2g0133261 [Rosa chinensis]